MQESPLNTQVSGKKIRDTGLDFLRFLAVCLVLFRHMELSESFQLDWAQPLLWLKRGGWIGVDIFFVLSGFLVSGLLFKEYSASRNLSIKRFLIRRGLKIYPALWFMIGVTVMFRHFVQHREISYRGLLGEFLFIQNYFQSIWVQTWSLAVEEHFYLLLSAVTFVLVRKNRSSPDPFRFLPWFFALSAVTCFLLRWATVAALPVELKWHALFPSHLRIESLLFGVIISYLMHFRISEQQRLTIRRNRYIFLFIGIALCLPAFLVEVTLTPWMVVGGPTLFYLGAGSLLLFFISADFSKSLAVTFCARLGTYSYSVYLWHQAVQEWSHPVFLKFFNGNLQWILWTTFYLIGSWFIGILLARLIEFPVLRLREIFFPPSEKLAFRLADPTVNSSTDTAGEKMPV